MEEKSIPIFKSPKSKSPDFFLHQNEDLWRRAMDTIPFNEQRRSSICFSTEFPSTGRKSLSFIDLNISDLGRESMGILPPDFGRDSLGFMNTSNLQINRDSLGFLQINLLKECGKKSIGVLPSDFGKDSSNFTNASNLEMGRESLGILQLDALKESFSFRRESLGILNFTDLTRESLDCGRESLGILHLKSPDVKFEGEDKIVPDIMLTTIEENSQNFNILDTGFLLSHSRKLSTLSSIYSISPSFNSRSLEGSSAIYSVSSPKAKYIMENSPIKTHLTCSYNYGSSSIHSPLNKGKLFSESDVDLRSRIQSAPETFCPSVDKTEKSPAEIFNGSTDFKEANKSSDFHDSVFIEGHILAEKIADGSILNEASIGDGGVLDSTPQPDWPDELSLAEDKENEGRKCDTETVFKTLDKMLPPSVKELLDTKLKTSRTDSNSSSENGEKSNTNDGNNSKALSIGEQNVSKLLHNISEIQHEQKRSPTNLNDPKEILENLFELFNEISCEKQKSEGQNLLNNLADMLSESKLGMKNNENDSGHSSTNKNSDSPDKDECFEVLDLRIKDSNEISSSNNIGLDLSLKSKQIENLIGNRLSRSLSLASPNIKTSDPGKNHASARSLDLSKNKSTSSSVNSNDSKNINNLTKPYIAGKLRQKHVSCNLKKGPMKAIIPVGEMKKKSDTPVTPEKNEQKRSIISKKTSTPINEPKMRPIAASTPTNQSAKDTPRYIKNPRNSINYSVAKTKVLNSSNSFTRDKDCPSTSLPRTSMINVGYRSRTSSVSGTQKPNGEALQRRNSVEKGSEIMSSVAKVRQNLNSPYRQPLKRYSEVEHKSLLGNRGKLGENRHLPVAKLSNVISKVKRPGKENVEK